jgi:hypothetical protein
VEPTEQDLDELAQRGVTRILLTNRNHVRAANRVRASTGARTAIHAGDAAYARGQGAELDDELQVGDKIGPLTVIGVPENRRAKWLSTGRSGGYSSSEMR